MINISEIFTLQPVILYGWLFILFIICFIRIKVYSQLLSRWENNNWNFPQSQPHYPNFTLCMFVFLLMTESVFLSYNFLNLKPKELLQTKVIYKQKKRRTFNSASFYSSDVYIPTILTSIIFFVKSEISSPSINFTVTVLSALPIINPLNCWPSATVTIHATGGSCLGKLKR